MSVDHLPDVVTRAETRCLLSIQTAPGERLTIRMLAQRLGLSVSTTHATVKRLRVKGLVGWIDYKLGTLHATVRPVSITNRFER